MGESDPEGCRGKRARMSAAAIRARAAELGFDAVGVARAEAPPGAGEGLAAFLAAGHHGGM